MSDGPSDQTMAEVSKLPEITRRPSGEAATARTGPPCPRSCANALLAPKSTSRAVPRSRAKLPFDPVVMHLNMAPSVWHLQYGTFSNGTFGLVTSDKAPSDRVGSISALDSSRWEDP